MMIGDCSNDVCSSSCLCLLANKHLFQQMKENGFVALYRNQETVGKKNDILQKTLCFIKPIFMLLHVSLLNNIDIQCQHYSH